MFGFLSIHRTESNGMCEVNGSKAKYGNLLKRVKHISSMNHTKNAQRTEHLLPMRISGISAT